MIDYTLSSLSERMDTNFVISCWLPAFVAVLANLGLFTVLVGPDAMAAWAVQPQLPSRRPSWW